MSISKLGSELSLIGRYIGSGAINTIIGFTVIFLAMALGCSPVVSNIAGYAVGFSLGFVLSKKFVFRSNGHFVSESLRYLVAFVIAFLFNLLVLSFTLKNLHLHAIAAQFIAAFAYTIVMYLLARVFVFSR